MRPAGRFCCNAPGCKAALEWAEGVYTVEQQVAALAGAGWRVGLGNATCAEHVPPAPAPVPPSTSLIDALRASIPLAAAKRIARTPALWSESKIEEAGGSLAHTAGRFGR